MFDLSLIYVVDLANENMLLFMFFVLEYLLCLHFPPWSWKRPSGHQQIILEKLSMCLHLPGVWGRVCSIYIPQSPKIMVKYDDIILYTLQNTDICWWLDVKVLLYHPDSFDLHRLCSVFKFDKIQSCKRIQWISVTDRKWHILQVVEVPFNTTHLSDNTSPMCHPAQLRLKLGQSGPHFHSDGSLPAFTIAGRLAVRWALMKEMTGEWQTPRGQGGRKDGGRGAYKWTSRWGAAQRNATGEDVPEWKIDAPWWHWQADVT